MKNEPTLSPDQKRALYRAGQYRFRAPAVCCARWNDDDWIAFIDAYRGWIVPPTKGSASMKNEPILSPATRAQLARASLADARRLIREAQRYAGYSSAGVRHALAEARYIIASARRTYTEAMRACAQRGQLTHHYAPTRDGRHRAAVRVPGGATVWASLTTYGRRQSAQRAAANHIGRLARQGV